MTDSDHVDARRAVLADIAATLPPGQLVGAALDLVVQARKDLAQVTASLTAERALTKNLDEAIDAMAEDAELASRAAYDLLNQVAVAAGVPVDDAEPAAVITADIVATIASLRARVAELEARPELTEAQLKAVLYTVLDDRAADAAPGILAALGTATLPTPDRAASAAPTPPRYVAITRDKIPPGTPPDRLAWFSVSTWSAVRVCKALNGGAIDRDDLEWGGTPLNGPIVILDRGAPAVAVDDVQVDAAEGAP